MIPIIIGAAALGSAAIGAIASGNNDQLALALNSLTELAKSSPFKDMANLASFQAALDDPNHVWTF
jgi:hypothetical protein